jgi:hypothetical protein
MAFNMQRRYRTCQIARASDLQIIRAAGPVCVPALAFKEVRLLPMRPPTLERTWIARLAVDASPCATASGPFAILFSRLKENGPELDFEEHFTWKPGLIEVSVDLAADEAVERFWLNPVPPCRCRD